VSRAVLLSLLLVLLHAAPVRAQGDEEAQRLFREGVDAAGAGDYVTACAKFSRSLELVRRASTLLNLAICEAEQGKLASALRRYEEGIQALPAGDPRADEARAGMNKLAPRVPRLTVKLAGDTPASARVLVDGREMPQGEREKIPLDPGTHDVTLAVAGRKDVAQRVRLREGQSEVIELVQGPPEGASDTAPVPVERAPDASADQGGVDPLLAIGITVAGVGLAGLAVGGALGAMTLSEVSAAEEDPELCPDKVCSPAGREAVDAARGKGIGSTIALAVGGVALVTGVVLVVISRTGGGDEAAVRLSPIVGSEGGGAELAVAF
jgi:hypothetical protein